MTITANKSISSSVYQVSELNRLAKNLLEQQLSLVWVEGEISNLSCPSSGHAYFSLKDSKAQVRCALFRFRHQNLNIKLKDGLHVIVQARVSLYEARGDFQLIIEHLEEHGDGLLQRQFERLKKELADQGLFAQEHKKPLPKFPKQIGVITSPTGAVIRDILSVLHRRFPSIPVILYPTAVQGEAAAEQIVQALKLANQRQECDVLIIARGGGSLEDLWPFNEEKVAHAIFNSHLPVVSAIGHEVDFTIADFVADQRAPTPSVAAELVSPNQADYWQQVVQLGRRLKHQITQELYNRSQHVRWLNSRLQHPEQRLLNQAQFLDQLEQRLMNAQKHLTHLYQAHLQQQRNRLWQLNPNPLLAQARNQVTFLNRQLTYQIESYLKQCIHQLQQKGRALDTVNPLSTLERGYAIILDAQGNVIRNTAQVNVGNKIKARLWQGELVCEVLESR